MKQLQSMIWLVALAGVALLATGCESLREETCTGRLWSDGLTQHYQPAPRPEVKMFQQPGDCGDVLVQYIEQREKTGATGHRAYYALANEDRVQNLQKPRFVTAKCAASLTPIPVEPAGRINLAAPVWAELTPDANGFCLHRNGVVSSWHHLPVYIDHRGDAERVLLTPVTVTADAAVVVAVVAVVGGVLYLEGTCGCYDSGHDCYAWNNHR